MTSYFPLGVSGLRVPRLWLGATMFGDQTDEAQAREIVAATRDAGLNAIDVADNYAGGESERMVGRLIAADCARWIVASKVANPMSSEPNDRGLLRRWLLAEVDNSVRRLGTDWIDLWYLHRDDEVTPVEETVLTLERLIEAARSVIGACPTSASGASRAWWRRRGAWACRCPLPASRPTAP